MKWARNVPFVAITDSLVFKTGSTANVRCAPVQTMILTDCNWRKIWRSLDEDTITTWLWSLDLPTWNMGGVSDTIWMDLCMYKCIQYFTMGRGGTQGQIVCRVKLLWIKTFHYPKLLILSRQKSTIRHIFEGKLCIHAFPKGINGTWN